MRLCVLRVTGWYGRVAGSAELRDREREGNFSDLGDRMNREQATELLSKFDSTTKLFSLAGLKTYCQLVSLHDLDTISVVFPFQGRDVHKINCRVLGLDSAELTSKNPIVKAWAVKARNRMLSLIAPGVFEVDGSYAKKDIKRLLAENVSMLYIHSYEYEKFGRLLVDLFLDESASDRGETLQAICIREGYAKPYDGKTKSQWVPEDCRLNVS
jgi:endonuclease YncB( thermonuclease family)